MEGGVGGGAKQIEVSVVVDTQSSAWLHQQRLLLGPPPPHSSFMPPKRGPTTIIPPTPLPPT